MEIKTMNKNYIQPNTEIVQVRLRGSVLDDIPVVDGSYYTDEGLGKENNFDWEDDASADRPRNINLWEE